MSNDQKKSENDSGKGDAKSAKLQVLSEREVPGVGKVRVVTDGKRTWKEAPKDSGMGPLQ